MNKNLMRRVKPCPNCKGKPRFVESDDPEYPFLLVHDNEDCPGTYRASVYHTSEEACVESWNQMTEDLAHDLGMVD